jgi:hypothetical protein
VAFLSDKAFLQTGWCATLVPHSKGTLLVAFASLDFHVAEFA